MYFVIILTKFNHMCIGIADILFVIDMLRGYYINVLSVQVQIDIGRLVCVK